MFHPDNPADPAPLPSPTLAQAEPEEGRIGYGRYARYSPLGLALLIALIVAGVWWWQGGGDDAGGGTVGGFAGRPAPDIELTTFDGATVRLSELEGSVVVVNFWAEWCAPCREEMPAFEDVFAQTMQTGEPVVFLGVNLKYGPEEDARRLLEELGITYITGRDSGGEDPMHGPIERAFGIPQSYPATVFIRPNGVIDTLRIGPMDEDELRERMKHAAD